MSTLVRFIFPHPLPSHGTALSPRGGLRVGHDWGTFGGGRAAPDSPSPPLRRLGDLGEGDKQANEEALQTGERILSRYDLDSGSFYIVTEADRSVTTVMGVEES